MHFRTRPSRSTLPDMKTFTYRTRLAIEDLAVVDRPLPRIAPHEVLVRIDAVSLEYRDLAIARGAYGALPLPLVPASSGAGEVVATGSEVSRFAVSDRVSPVYVPAWRDGPVDEQVARGRLGGPLDGVLAEYVAVHEDALVRTPAGWSAADAATLPVAAVSAWQALVTDGGTRPGDDVAITGTGAAALFAVAIARTVGARPIVVGRDAGRLERARALGAVVVDVNDSVPWDARLRALTGGRGVDLFLDAVGGDTLDRTVASTRVGGTVSLFGFAAGMRTSLDLFATIRRAVTLRATSGGSRRSFEDLVRAIDRGAPIRAIVDRTVPFEDARAAFVHLADGRPFGKVIITREAA